ncbi:MULTISPECIES: purine-cytosine permease family protein [Caballeronia]|uniref:purine-cytosine permease family protein n=1 Tax=Caballeronia TaxID=1827195 RepID=UPI001FD559AC|nr:MULTISPECIES: cytosine permease [Caballeronia]MDR5799126.1 cytosine permease [Caballeronia sp. LZ001]
MANFSDDDFAGTLVPESQRRSWQSIFAATLGVGTALFFAQITSIITRQSGVGVALLSVVYGFVVSAFIGVLISRLSIKSGCGTNILAKAALGHRGAALFSILYGTACLTYFVAEAGIIGASLRSLLPQISNTVLLPSVVLCMLPLVWVGMRAISAFQKFSIIIYGGLLTAAIYVTVGGHSGSPSVGIFRGDTIVGLASAISMMNGVAFVVGLLTADYARFIKRDQLSAGTIAIGIVFPAFCYGVTGIAGIWFAAQLGESNPGVYFVQILGSVGGIVFTCATQLRTNISNMYSGTLAFVNAFERALNIRMSRRLVTVLFAAVASLILVSDATELLQKTLGVLGIFTAAFVCVLLIESYLPNTSRYRAASPNFEGMIEPCHWSNLLSVIVATGIGIAVDRGVLGPSLSALAIPTTIAAPLFWYVGSCLLKSPARRTELLD